MAEKSPPITIKVSPKVHSKMTRRIGHPAYGTFPPCYLLGKDKEGVITKAISIYIGEDNIGCEDMPSLAPSALARAMIRIIKEKTTPCGIARIDPCSDSGIADTLQDLHRIAPNAFIISYGEGWIDVYNANRAFAYAVTESK